VKKVVLPKVLKFLHSGNHIVSGVYPRILPLLAGLQKTSDKQNGLGSEFYSDLLVAIRQGLKTFVVSNKKNQLRATGIYSSQYGATACVAAFFEAAVYGLRNEVEKTAIYAQVCTKIGLLLGLFIIVCEETSC
jgi:hypothetical protein